MARFAFAEGRQASTLAQGNAPFPLSQPEALPDLPSLQGEPVEKQCDPAGVSFNSADCPVEEASTLVRPMIY